MLTRDGYVEKKKGELDAWNTEMAVLESKVAKDKEAVKKNIREQMKLLRVKQQTAEKQLGSIRAATKDSWQHFRNDTDNVWLALKDSMAEFRSHFS